MFTYRAEFDLTETGYIVYFPEFDVRGVGYSDLDDSIEFAGDMLSEILIDYVKRGKTLPGEQDVVDKQTNEDEKGHVIKSISVDIDLYQKQIKENEERVFYDFESDEDVRHRNASATKKFKEIIVKANKLIRINKKVVILCITLACIIACGIIAAHIYSSHMKAVAEEKARLAEIEKLREEDNAIEEARDAIRNQNYEQVESYLQDVSAPSNYRERENLKKYAQLNMLHMESETGNLEKQHQLAEEIMFSPSDEFYNDCKELKTVVNEEYSNYKAKKEREERIARVKKEDALAKTEKDRLRQLAKELPQKGMDVNDLNNTSAGAYNEKHINLIYSSNESCDEEYYWVVPVDDHAPSRVLEVYAKDGKVIEVDKEYEKLYWSDEKPLFLDEISKTKKKSKDTPETSNYNTGIEYADAKEIDYIKSLVETFDNPKSKYYGSSENDVKNIAWLNAFDDWINSQKPYIHDEEAEQEAIDDIVSNSKN